MYQENNSTDFEENKIIDDEDKVPPTSRKSTKNNNRKYNKNNDDKKYNKSLKNDKKKCNFRMKFNISQGGRTGRKNQHSHYSNDCTDDAEESVIVDNITVNDYNIKNYYENGVELKKGNFIINEVLAAINVNNDNKKWSKRKQQTIYKYMKNFLRKKFLNSKEEARYIEIFHNIKVINNNLNNSEDSSSNSNCTSCASGSSGRNNSRNNTNNNSSNFDNNCANKFNVMQDVRLRVERSNHGSPNHQRPIHLFPAKSNLNNCSNDINTNNNNNHSSNNNNNIHKIQSRSPSCSEEDNSPTELNNCRRLIDKPPLVKRLTMGLLRSTEESRPLVHNNASPTSGSTHTISDGYVNEGICDPDKTISSKFGDSCRKSLTVLDKDCADKTCEFDFKKNFIRETSSANSSPKIFSPSAPMRIDGLSLTEQNELKGAAWFQAGIPREISLDILSRQNPGAFLVRQSSTKPGCFALSLRVPPPAPKVAHYLILKTNRGYKIKGFTKEFTSLRALITHHSVMPELLPVPLALPRPQNIIPQRRHLDDFGTYGSLNDFRKMMSDLNI